MEKLALVRHIFNDEVSQLLAFMARNSKYQELKATVVHFEPMLTENA